MTILSVPNPSGILLKPSSDLHALELPTGSSDFSRAVLLLLCEDLYSSFPMEDIIGILGRDRKTCFGNVGRHAQITPVHGSMQNQMKV